jgi:hypothetical protein
MSSTSCITLDMALILDLDPYELREIQSGNFTEEPVDKLKEIYDRLPKDSA